MYLFFKKYSCRLDYFVGLECSYGTNDVGYHTSTSLEGKKFRVIILKSSIFCVRNANIYALCCSEIMK